MGRITSAVVLRRLVAQVADDLPDRIEVNVPLELGDELARSYTEIRQETLIEYPSAGALVATGRLQMFCAHPWLHFTSESTNEDALASNRHYGSLSTPKIQRTVSILEEAFVSGKKVLLFTLYNGCIDIFENATQGLPTAFWGAINGSTPQADRQGIVDAFSEYEGPGCLVLNPKAAGAGLNITAATVVIHFTLAWNPALEMQASARAHRRGQTAPVHIYRLFYANTVEEVMLDRSERRRALGESAVPVSRDSEDLERALSIEP